MAKSSKSKKKSSKKTTQKTMEKPVSSPQPTNDALTPPSVISPKWIMAALGVAVVIIVALIVKNYWVVATVNGKPIYRHTIIAALEKQGGAQVLDQKITEMLIQDKAAAEGVSVSDEDVDAEIAKIEEQVASQGQTLDAMLEMQGMSRMALRDQIRTQKMVEALQPEAEEPSEEDIAQALEDQADSFPEDMSDEERRQQVVAQLTQQSQGSQIQDWIDQLQNEADIQYYKKY